MAEQEMPGLTLPKQKKIWVVHITGSFEQEDDYTFSTHKRAMDFIGHYVFEMSNPRWRQYGQEKWSDGKTTVYIQETILNHWACTAINKENKRIEEETKK